MCGLFGGICIDAEHAADFTMTVTMMGQHSEERGKDSAGIAFMEVSRASHDGDVDGASVNTCEHTTPTTEHSTGSHSVIDGVTTIRGIGLFRNLPLDRIPAATQGYSSLLFGHTRAASQGDVDDYANTSPLHIGAVTGTHNGDVSATSVPVGKAAAELITGETDSAYVFAAMHTANNNRRKMTEIFRRIRGRGAYAFVDRRAPHRLYLVRTAFTPLCFTYDQHGNFYYASNPDWFRRVHRAHPEIVFDDPTLLPEGMLVTVDTRTGEPVDARRFTPTCRPKDESIGEMTAYRGFVAADKAADKQLQRHKVSQKLPEWPQPATVPFAAAKPAETAKPVAGAKTSRRSDAGFTPYREDSAEDTLAPSFTYAGESLLDQRLAAETPDVFDACEEANAHGDYSTIDDLWDEIEKSCWVDGEFDEEKFERFITMPIRQAEDEYEQMRLAH